MKHLKSKLLVSTAMLLICAVMLSSVSYAWFTLSTNPEIKGMKATVVANENLEIALDNGYADEAAVDAASIFNSQTGVQGSTTANYTTWGNLIDITDKFNDSFMPTLQPVKFTNGSFQTLAYGVDGRGSELINLNASNTTGVKGYSKAAGTAPYYAFSVDFWVRSNVGGTLILQTAGVNRAEDDADVNNTVNNTAGAGSYIKAGSASTTEIESYFKQGIFRIVFKADQGSYVDATLTSKNNGTFELSCNNIVTLTKNTAQKVTMYVFIDGEKITNKDALLQDIQNVEFNVQFANTGITGDGSMTGDDAN